MKTTINLQDYEFSGKKVPKRQISDDPETGLSRVIEINRAEFNFDIDMIRLHAATHFISAEKKKVFFQKPTLVEGRDWDIAAGDKTILLGTDFRPVVNKDFDRAKPVTPENYPHILTDAYEQFRAILLSETVPVALPAILYMFIDSNDQKGLFN